METGAVSGNQAGFRTTVSLMERQNNARILGKFGISDTTSQRVFIGWVDDTAAFRSGADPLNAKNGFGLQIDHSVSANIRKCFNDGVGASTRGDYFPQIAIGTGTHTFEITADEAATKFSISVDGNTAQDFTTDIPASGQKWLFNAIQRQLLRQSGDYLSGVY